MIDQRIGAEQHECVDPAFGCGLQDPGCVGSGFGEERTVGTDTGGEPEFERSHHVAAPQGREHLEVGRHPAQGADGIDGEDRVLGQIASAQHHGDRTATRDQGCRTAQRGRVDARERTVDVAGRDGLGHLGHLTGQWMQRGRGMGQQRRGPGRELDDRGAVFHRCVAQPQEQRRKFFLRIGAEEHDHPAGGGGFGDRGPGQCQQGDVGEAVTELGVDGADADHLTEQLRPCVLALDRQPGAAEHGDPGRIGLDHAGNTASRFSPANGFVRGVGRTPTGQRQRRPKTVFGIDRLVAEAFLVGEPAPVHGVGVDPEDPQETVPRRLDHHPGPGGVDGRGRLVLGQIPGAGLEAVGLRRQRTDGADLHGVATEVGRERMIGEGVDLGVGAAADEVDQRVAGDLFGETCAAITQDAPLTVEVDQVADRDRLLVVPLLLDEAALAGSESVGVVLEGTLAALVAHGTVEGVVDQEQLEHTVLRCLGRFGLGVDGHLGRDGQHAAGLQGRTSPGVDLDEAHPAHADRGHSGVIAESWDVNAVAFGGLDQQFAVLGRTGGSVQRERHTRGRLRRGGVGGSHACAPAATAAESGLAAILASNSCRNRRIAEVIGATDDGPSGQIVVCFGGNGTAVRPASGWAATG